MKSRHFVERSAAGCFLALACCSVMLAQDALTATRKGLELMGQARYGEAEEFLHVLSRSRGRPIRPPFTIWRTFITGRVAFRKPSGYTAWLWSRLSAIMVDPEVAQSLNDLGALYRSVGRYSQAIEALERAVLILERNPPQKFACTVFNNLGSAYIDIGQYAKAESMIRRALAVIEFGRYEDASDLGYTLSCLGRVHALRKNYVEAEAAYSKALAIFGATVGSRRPEYALAQTNLALVYERQQRSRESLPLFKSAINILEGSHGRESPVLTSVLYGYAKAMRHIGRKSEARQIARRAKSMAGPRIGTVDVATLRHQRR